MKFCWQLARFQNTTIHIAQRTTPVQSLELFSTAVTPGPHEVAKVRVSMENGPPDWGMSKEQQNPQHTYQMVCESLRRLEA